MITKQTAYDIALCYDEIGKANTLAEKMQKDISEYKIPELRDAFGQRRNIQLGVPMSESGHRLYDVQPTLALAIIRAHAATKQSELIALNEIAKTECETP